MSEIILDLTEISQSSALNHKCERSDFKPRQLAFVGLTVAMHSIAPAIVKADQDNWSVSSLNF